MRDTAAGGISVVNHDDVADLFPFVGTFTGDPDVSGIYLLMKELPQRSVRVVGSKISYLESMTPSELG